MKQERSKTRESDEGLKVEPRRKKKHLTGSRAIRKTRDKQPKTNTIERIRVKRSVPFVCTEDELQKTLTKHRKRNRTNSERQCQQRFYTPKTAVDRFALESAHVYCLWVKWIATPSRIHSCSLQRVRIDTHTIDCPWYSQAGWSWKSNNKCKHRTLSAHLIRMVWYFYDCIRSKSLEEVRRRNIFVQFNVFRDAT